MSEVIIPDVIASDVPETVEATTLAELVQLFEKLACDEDRMAKYKEAEAIKAAFYKRLHKEKAEAGMSASEIVESEEDSAEDAVSENPLLIIHKIITNSLSITYLL